MATIAAQITELEAELALVKAQMAAVSASTANASFSVDGMSVTKTGSSMYRELREQRTRLEKSLQRLYRGGRGIVLDMSADESDGNQDYPLGNTTLVR